LGFFKYKLFLAFFCHKIGVAMTTVSFFVLLGFLCYTTSALPLSLANSTAALTNPCGIATNMLNTNDPAMKVTTEHLSDCADRPC